MGMMKYGFLLFILMLMLACSFPMQNQLNPDSFVEAVPEGNNSDGYPTSAEGVVRAFLISYQESEGNLTDYVVGSRSFEEVLDMLQFNGMIMGFMIQSASVSPEPPQAVVEVVISLGLEEVISVFSLMKENDVWKISTIESRAIQSH